MLTSRVVLNCMFCNSLPEEGALLSHGDDFSCSKTR